MSSERLVNASNIFLKACRAHKKWYWDMLRYPSKPPKFATPHFSRFPFVCFLQIRRTYDERQRKGCELERCCQYRQVISLNWQMPEGSRSEAERQLELYYKKKEDLNLYCKIYCSNKLILMHILIHCTANSFAQP